MKRIIITSILVFVSAFVYQLNAQDYQTAIGARLGYPLSASIKHFITENNALEFYVGSRWYNRYRWANVSGAYLIHFPIEEVDGLKWYAGAGASIYFWGFDKGFADNSSNTSIGLQGYLGLEYTFDEVPINLSVDWIPTIFLNGYYESSRFGGGYGSLAVRYVLSR